MKRVKMVLYGTPGVGKSVFASKAPKPFFICTDGNYEWLEEFGADPKAHVNVSSWSDAKDVFEKINSGSIGNFETIVIDLTEDLFKWCEQEYCLRNKIEHLSDLGYGKAYDATRNEFFIEMCKLIALDKNIIFIMHGITSTVKDRRGVEHTHYYPTSRIPDKVLDMIEGRVRYFLRCYLKDEELEDGTLIKRRYLSLIPKPDEFGICRGVNENDCPHDIPLEWSEFAKAIGLNVESKFSDIKQSIDNDDSKDKTIESVEQAKQSKAEHEQISIDIPVAKMEIKDDVNDEVKDEVKEEVKEETVEEPQISEEDRIAQIKAKLAARFAAIKK